MIKESEYFSKVIETEFNKLLAMTNSKDFKNSTKCWISKKAYEGDKVEVKDHDGIIGKNRESAHQECYLNLSLSKKPLLCFIICKCMIQILSSKKLEYTISK